MRGLGDFRPRRAAQLRIVEADAAMGGAAADRLSATGHLAAQAVALAQQAGDAELTCEALELAAASVRIKDLGAAAEMLRRELAIAERAGLVRWRLRALNELGTVEGLRDARADRLERALELALQVGAIDIAASAAINLAATYAMTGAIEPALTAAEHASQLAEPLGATAAVAAATAIEAVAHGFAGRHQAGHTDPHPRRPGPAASGRSRRRGCGSVWPARGPWRTRRGRRRVPRG